MTFLDLCRKTAKLSGTLGDGVPASVVGQTGRVALIVQLVADAWVTVQNARPDWLWRRAAFEKPLPPGTPAVTAAGLALERFGAWLTPRPDWYVWREADGPDSAARVIFLPWTAFSDRYGHPAARPGPVRHMTVRPGDRALMAGPVPDAPHRLRGQYVKSPQVLAGNADTPDLPAHHHDVIVDTALRMLHAYDEADFRLAVSERDVAARMAALVHEQVETPYLAVEPIA